MRAYKRMQSVARSMVPSIRDEDDYSLWLTVEWGKLANRYSYEWFRVQFAQRELDRRKRVL